MDWVFVIIAAILAAVGAGLGWWRSPSARNSPSWRRRNQGSWDGRVAGAGHAGRGERHVAGREPLAVSSPASLRLLQGRDRARGDLLRARPQGKDERKTRKTTVYSNMRFGQCLVEDTTGSRGARFRRRGRRGDQDRRWKLDRPRPVVAAAWSAPCSRPPPGGDDPHPRPVESRPRLGTDKAHVGVGAVVLRVLRCPASRARGRLLALSSAAPMTSPASAPHPAGPPPDRPAASAVASTPTLRDIATYSNPAPTTSSSRELLKTRCALMPPSRGQRQLQPMPSTIQRRSSRRHLAAALSSNIVGVVGDVARAAGRRVQGCAAHRRRSMLASRRRRGRHQPRISTNRPPAARCADLGSARDRSGARQRRGRRQRHAEQLLYSVRGAPAHADAPVSRARASSAASRGQHAASAARVARAGDGATVGAASASQAQAVQQGASGVVAWVSDRRRVTVELALRLKCDEFVAFPDHPPGHP